jgi:glycine/D-amino acid oxidase-like deaminating enzyme
VIKNFQHRYLISAVDSKVTPKQFEYFMQSIGAPLFEDESWRKKHTDCYLVDKAYIAEEYAFDWKTLSHTLLEQLERAKRFEIIFNFEVTAINNNHGIYTLFSSCGEHVEADVVVNATYSNINKVSCMLSESSQVKLKHELTELALVEPPPELEGFAVTVMCGPFFSLMPYPSEGAYSLSHVRYTPHVEWRDVISKPPYRVLEQHIKTSNFNWMKLDASRFIPSLRGLDYKSSIWEVKSVLEKSELNDDRPVLFKRDGDFYQVFGGKIDNIFELDSLVEESFSVR